MSKKMKAVETESSQEATKVFNVNEDCDDDTFYQTYPMILSNLLEADLAVVRSYSWHTPSSSTDYFTT